MNFQSEHIPFCNATFKVCGSCENKIMRFLSFPFFFLTKTPTSGSRLPECSNVIRVEGRIHVTIYLGMLYPKSDI